MWKEKWHKGWGASWIKYQIVSNSGCLFQFHGKELILGKACFVWMLHMAKRELYVWRSGENSFCQMWLWMSILRVTEDLGASFFKANLLLVTQPNKAIQPSGHTPGCNGTVGKKNKPFCLIVCLAWKTRAHMFAYLMQRFCIALSDQIPVTTKHDKRNPDVG